MRSNSQIQQLRGALGSGFPPSPGQEHPGGFSASQTPQIPDFFPHFSGGRRSRDRVRRGGPSPAGEPGDPRPLQGLCGVGDTPGTPRGHRGGSWTIPGWGSCFLLGIPRGMRHSWGGPRAPELPGESPKLRARPQKLGCPSKGRDQRIVGFSGVGRDLKIIPFCGQGHFPLIPGCSNPALGWGNTSRGGSWRDLGIWDLFSNTKP